jgi:hypothetical protein
MSRPDPIEYAERLYAAIRAANFSPISFLAFGNAVKEGVELRRMPRIAAEPFMRVVGEMLELEGAAVEDEIIDADVTLASRQDAINAETMDSPRPAPDQSVTVTTADRVATTPADRDNEQGGGKP